MSYTKQYSKEKDKDYFIQLNI